MPRLNFRRIPRTMYFAFALNPGRRISWLLSIPSTFRRCVSEPGSFFPLRSQCELNDVRRRVLLEKLLPYKLPRMKKTAICVLWLSIAAIGGRAQTPVNDADFKLALPAHQGQLHWHADGFKIVQSSAKPNGVEIGIRGSNGSSQVSFLGFLFLVPEQAPLTSPKCRDGAIEPLKKSNPTLKILASSEMERSQGPPIELVKYSVQGRDGKLGYSMRGFVATGDICGDLEFYSGAPINTEDPDLKKIWGTYRFDP